MTGRAGEGGTSAGRTPYGRPHKNVDPARPNLHGAEMQRLGTALIRIVPAVGLAVLLGAAGPEGMQVEVTDIGPLARSEPAPAKTLGFQNTMYQAAPVPDEDVAAPPGAVQTEAQLAPKMLAPTTLYQGDGYSNGSSQQGTLEHRKAAAAGLGLSVPVN